MAARFLRVELLLAITLAATAAPSHAASIYVGNDGVDGATCGVKTAPCRSIGQAIAHATDGDTIIVGPGRYGDLDHDGVLASSAGEENPAVFSPGCGCVVAINKSVSVVSSAGAGSTVIDGSTVSTHQNVVVIASNLAFGKPAKGFTVTATAAANSLGIGIDGNAITISGNQIFGGTLGMSNDDTGIGAVPNDAETVTIQGNQVTGWEFGVIAGTGKTVRKNEFVSNFEGFNLAGSAAALGNVVVSNQFGASATGAASVIGNAFRGNVMAGLLLDKQLTAGIVRKNDFVGNGASGGSNCGISAFASSVADATDNYWGSASGPGPDPADSACLAGQAVTTTAFATKPFAVKASGKF